MFLTHIPDDMQGAHSIHYELHEDGFFMDSFPDDYSCDWMRDSECFARCRRMTLPDAISLALCVIGTSAVASLAIWFAERAI